MSFESNLATGKVAEGLIAKWLMARGSSVLPAYQIEKSSGKGPQLFSIDGELVVPDMLVFNHDGIAWIESKHKTVFTWHRQTQQWTTGIDIRHYSDYLHVAKQTKLPVWLLFFHNEKTPSERDLVAGCPRECPTGLFGGELFYLVTNENHRSLSYDPSRSGFKGHGKSGMVYWSHKDLRQLATKETILNLASWRDQQIAA